MLFPSQCVADISWRGYSLPFRHPYVTSTGQSTFRYGLLLFIRSGAGITGIGEASPVGPGTLPQVEAIIAVLAAAKPQLVGNSIDSFSEISLPIELPACLRFGLETACLDIQGKVQGRSLSVLLGGRPSQLPCNALITALSAGEAVKQTRQAISQGFATLKVKIGRATLTDDEALVSAVRETAGPAVKLRLDPNQAWGVTQAIVAINDLAKYDIEYFEQPVPARNIEGLAEVRRNVSVPIAADESLDSPERFRTIIDARAADVFILKAAQLGGISGTLKVAREALARSCRVIVTTSLESGIGIAASAHIASTLPVTATAQGLATGLLYKEDLISPSLVPLNGYLATPTGPGLGVKLSSKIQELHG